MLFVIELQFLNTENFKFYTWQVFFEHHRFIIERATSVKDILVGLQGEWLEKLEKISGIFFYYFRFYRYQRWKRRVKHSR